MIRMMNQEADFSSSILSVVEESKVVVVKSCKEEVAIVKA